MAKPTSINISNTETLRVLDEYSTTQGISRSSVIRALLDATAPILKHITHHHRLADELKARLLSCVYHQDSPPMRPVVEAERFCSKIWEKDLLAGIGYDFDSSNGSVYVLSKKRHFRRDKFIGKVEHRQIKDICRSLIKANHKNAKYACFIYIDRVILTDGDSKKEHSSPIKVAAGDAIILLAKDVVYNEYFFDLSKAIMINTIDLIPLGISGITEASKDALVYCWVPILILKDIVVIVPVYKIDPLSAPTLKKPDQITIIYRVKNNVITHDDS